MTTFPNRAISASAGTGKTFRLAHRYIGLLAAGVSPDRICALTFSRKAAAEIFDKIVEQLCAAATNQKQRIQTAEIIKKEGFPPPPDQPEAYLALLRDLVDHSHRLRIGTLDSFILGIIRAFPLELGIPPNTQPIDGDGGEAETLRQNILARIFDPLHRGPSSSTPSADAVLSAFREARYGEVSKKLASLFDELITQYAACYRTHSTAEWKWGEPAAIWSGETPWWDVLERDPLPDFHALKRTIETALHGKDMPKNFPKDFIEIIGAALGEPESDKVRTFKKVTFQRLLKEAHGAHPPEIISRNKPYAIPAEAWNVLRRVIAHVISGEVQRLCKQTRGLKNVLSIYEARYAEMLTADGRFTFEDLSRLLGSTGSQPSRQHATSESNRLYIDYRLDGQLDHWLLDEFQDTSDTQWQALANLIDEVIQDDSRSFFYVGDVKQSIYGWRGGNHRLFHRVLNQYSELGSRSIIQEPMSLCFRSLPAVIETVNRVFDRLDDWCADTDQENGPRESAIQDFLANWQPHESARQNEGEGFSALLEYPRGKSFTPTDSSDEAEEEAPLMYQAVANILKQIDPTSRELTTAVLVRSNKAGRACVDCLRQELPGVPVVHEGKGGIVDNPVVTLLLALLRFAAHPGDTVALRHLQMSPLANEAGVIDCQRLPDVILSAVHETGCAETLRDWGKRLGPLDAFGDQRLHELLAAAEQFDAMGSCDIDAFLNYVSAYHVQSTASAGTVRVMTVHQSKGLGFDIVIVPFPERDKSFEKPGDPELLIGADWLLKPPGSELIVGTGDPINNVLDAERATSNFSQLCVLYVALTRAQQALYMIIPEASKSSTAFRDSDLLRQRLAPEGTEKTSDTETLTQLAAFGNPSWFKAHPHRSTASVAPAAVDHVSITYTPEMARLEPSKERDESRPFPAQWLFGEEAGDVMAFGSAIHRLFQLIEWLGDVDIDVLIADWRRASPEPSALLDDVEAQFRHCLNKDAVQQQLRRPAGAVHAEVWNEAPFQLVLEERGEKVLTSGRFDRVVVERDAENRPVRATVLDFKSNRIQTHDDMEKAAEGYAFQMDHYARAVARLLNLPVDCVATRLIFTRKGWVYSKV